MTFFEARCTLCNRNWTIRLPYEDSVFRLRWDMWGQGRLIQDVFPELTPQEREGLKTGICKQCWHRVFEVKK